MLSLLQRRKSEQVATGTSADISGSVSDSQLAIGEHIVQNNIAAGAIVNQIAGESGPRPPRPRDKPVSVKPREAPRLVGRASELDAATSALGARQPVQFSGRAGAGKTAMLRHLAHSAAGAFPDGVIYYRSRSESLDDLLMRIFEFLYASDERLKPTNAELCLYLEETQALLLLDDVDLDREDLETLLLTLPRSVFVFGSPERSLWCDGTAIGLRGLGDDAALMLVEQYLGRPLASDEGADFAELCRALDGQPLQIIKAVTQVREEGVPAHALVPPNKPFPAAPEQLSAQMVQTLTPEAREALMLMAALGGAPLHVEHIAALTGAGDSARLLADLEQRGLAKSHSPRYSLTDSSAGSLPPDEEARWRRRLLTYFADHAEAHAGRPERLRDDLEPIIATLRKGAAAGEWQPVMRLARAADGPAAASKLWGAWGAILAIALDAARHLGDEAQEGWALHQLGTRALCLGDTDEASRRLSEALRIRERIGDRAAEITRHNMSQLPGAPPPPPPAGSSGMSPWITPLCAAVVALAGVGAIISTSSGDPGRDDPSDRAAAVTPARDTVPPQRDRGDDGDSPSSPRSDEPTTQEAPDVDPPLRPPDDPPVDPPVDPPPIDPPDDPPPVEPDRPPDRPVVTDPTDPVAPLRACSPDAVSVLSSMIEAELEVLEPLLAVDAPAAVQEQVDVLQQLLAHLRSKCKPQDIDEIARVVAAR